MNGGNVNIYFRMPPIWGFCDSGTGMPKPALHNPTNWHPKVVAPNIVSVT